MNLNPKVSLYEMAGTISRIQQKQVVRKILLDVRDDCVPFSSGTCVDGRRWRWNELSQGFEQGVSNFLAEQVFDRRSAVEDSRILAA